MGVAILLLILIVILFVAGAAIGFVAKIFLMLLVGLIIGALARLIIPGKQTIGILLTAIVGTIGSLLGGLTAHYLHPGGNVIEFILSMLMAVFLIVALSAKPTPLLSRQH